MSMTQPKTRVAVLFGGRSTEHEISVITALQVMDAFDVTRYEIIPVYIDSDGRWLTGDLLRKRENYPLSTESARTVRPVRLVAEYGARLEYANAGGGWFSKADPVIPVDLYFPAFHGTFGEDGCIQGLLEWIGAPYTGSGPRAASVGMNKYASKRLLAAHGAPVLPDLLITSRDWDPNAAHLVTQRILQELSFPLMVKPCNLGSSIAISSAHTEEQLMISLAGAFAFDDQVLVEPLLQDMYELNVSVLNGAPPRASAIERPRRDNALLTFEDKYMRGGKKKGGRSEGMASLQRDLNPADVPAETLAGVRDCAIAAFTALDCRGLVRFDFLVDKSNGRFYFNEVNVLPGSFAYYLWEKAEPRLSFTELLTTLAEQALEDHKARRRIRRGVESRVLGH
ncbi:MAG: D-alanine--D-alanine ligase [bacterium]|nr:D-alanine--D-alanine ligase [bacterium]